MDGMSQSFTIKRVRHTGASVYIGEVDGRDTWTRNPEAIVNWLCDGWRTRFNQLRSCRQKTVWVDGVEARHPDGTKVLAPLGNALVRDHDLIAMEKLRVRDMTRTLPSPRTSCIQTDRRPMSYTLSCPPAVGRISEGLGFTSRKLS